MALEEIRRKRVAQAKTPHRKDTLHLHPTPSLTAGLAGKANDLFSVKGDELPTDARKMD